MDRYVVHDCKNKKCNNAWIDKDVTRATTYPPKWRYCPECCDKYGYVNKRTVCTETQAKMKRLRELGRKAKANHV